MVEKDLSSPRSLCRHGNAQLFLVFACLHLVRIPFASGFAVNRISCNDRCGFTHKGRRLFQTEVQEDQDETSVVIVESHTAPETFDWSTIDITESHIARLKLAAREVSVPVALMIVDPVSYPSLSRARRACRKGSIVVERCLVREGEPHRFVGRVGDRVFSNDIISRQQRMAPESAMYETALSIQGKPPFELPVVYEDDHMAIVNKPAGIVVHRQGKATSGLLTIRGSLQFVLKPPKSGTMNTMKRPASVHRLDKPTSGVLVVAKTKTALVELARQFRTRSVKKTYMAIVQGIPNENFEDSVPSSIAAERWDVDTADYDDSIRWNVIDMEIYGKSTVTVWRAVKYVKSLHAGFLTLVELKPKTGRYHQLRRHMAWICETPIVGDAKYDGNTEVSQKFRSNGLFLCATKVVLQHPFYNTAESRELRATFGLESPLVMSSDGSTIQVAATIPLPGKFQSLLKREEERYHKFASDGFEAGLQHQISLE